MTQDILLQVSPFEIDKGRRIGQAPEDVPTEILAQNFSARKPLAAIRAKCLDCCCGQSGEVRKCAATACPLWPFRLGGNPFRKRARLSPEERERRARRLRRVKANENPGASGNSHRGRTKSLQLVKGVLAR